MWFQVLVPDLALVERWTEVMRFMNHNYHGLSVAKVRSWLARSPGESWYYNAEGVEIAIRFQFVPKRARYQLANVGFRGTANAAEVLDLVINKSLEFVNRHQLPSLFAVRPKGMEDPGIESFHTLVPQHPRVRVTVERDFPGHVLWTLEPAIADGQAEPSAAGIETVMSRQV